MKDTEYRPEPLEAPDIAQEDIPETPAEAEAVLPVVLPDLSESRPVVTGEPMEGPEAVPEDREVVLTYLQDPPREVVEYYLHKARLPRQGDAPAPAPAGSIDRQLAQAAEGKPEPPAPKRPGRRRRRRAILITLGILLLVAVIAVLVFHFTRSDAPDESREPYPGYEQTATDQAITIPSCRARKDLRVELAAGHGEALTAEEVYARVNPATVTVVCDVSDTSASVGTGVIITADGYVLTNHHVVAGGRNCTVTLSDNVQYEAKYVVSDEVNDLAVLKIVDARDLPTAELGDSSLLTVGETVYAIGNPLGVELRGTFTDGLVSALDRDVDVDGVSMVLIQTSAAINMGNSGGALINQYGQVVGITTVKIVTDDGSAEALGFAIPSRRVKYVADTLIAGKTVRRGIFGFTVLTRPAQGGGLTLDSVDKASDAYAQGLRAGDVLIAANGQSLNAVEDLVRLKQSLGAGDAVSLTYVRDGQSYTASVALIDPDD